MEKSPSWLKVSAVSLLGVFVILMAFSFKDQGIRSARMNGQPAVEWGLVMSERIYWIDGDYEYLRIHNGVSDFLLWAVGQPDRVHKKKIREPFTEGTPAEVRSLFEQGKRYYERLKIPLRRQRL